MPKFTDSRLKIERADKHIADFEQSILALEDSQATSIEINPSGGNKFLKYDFDIKTFSESAPLIIGDAVHNLKCALDYAWLNTIEVLVPSAVGKFAKFPIYNTADDLENALRGREINVHSPDLFKLMTTKINPHKRGDFAIWTVHDLDKRDKHRLLIPLIKFVSIKGAYVKDETGREFGFHTTAIAEAPPFRIPISNNLTVKENGKVSVAVIFDPKAVEDSPRVGDTLVVYSCCILEVVETLEAFLETV